VKRPDILILEGLGVLHTGTGDSEGSPGLRARTSSISRFISDADERLIRKWFIERFLTFRETAFRDPTSFFRKFAELSVRDREGDGDQACGTTSTGGTSRRTSSRRETAPI
jgi:type I pantothenate kinase